MCCVQVSALNSSVTPRNSAAVPRGVHRLAIKEREVKFASNGRQDVDISSLAKPQLRANFLPGKRATKHFFHTVCKSATADTIVPDTEEEQEKTLKEVISVFAPTADQVQSLLMDVCDGTSIAELKVKVGDLELHMKRDVKKEKAAPVPPLAGPAQPIAASPPVTTVASPPRGNNIVSSILSAPVSKTASLFGLLEAAADQGLSFVTSPKVGIFRRARNTKGQTGKPLVEEGMTIKEGQIVGYLDQLGTKQPIEAQVSGQVVQVLWEDGESVGYGDPLISIRPSFPGIVSRAALN